eukprot:CAMPEP_0195600062 /NCGR_PEP_ID=MMETSP0815-20121206/4359_1 /TAXON_ID=97485 /ORGANISM="Prymnesium parvum, Strain Texoma1" /LENGTH=88 /DNA_ID=CAMNT_0040739527 /DNA_START=262 /DNA_END=525 /DNA_ORIENTATION=-
MKLGGARASVGAPSPPAPPFAAVQRVVNSSVAPPHARHASAIASRLFHRPSETPRAKSTAHAYRGGSSPRPSTHASRQYSRHASAGER